MYMCMRCPFLNELPPPPPGKIGWPWTESSPVRCEELSGSQRWPRVSIITPSFNQANFLEETIRSVLLQDYPDLEYVVVDGGSTDGSAEIIDRYSPCLSYWVSELDRGQSIAINKGFAHTTGEIVAWVNSDDILLPGALLKIGRAFMHDPAVGLVYGDYQVIDEKGNLLKSCITPEYDLKRMVLATWIAQGFVRRSALGGDSELVRNDLHYMMDWHLWLKVAIKHPGWRIPAFLGQVRLHSNAKTVAAGELFNVDRQRIVEWLYSNQDLPPVVWRQRRAAEAMCQYALAINAYNHANRREAFCRLLRSFAISPFKPSIFKRLMYLGGICLPPKWTFRIRRMIRERLHKRAYIQSLFGSDK